MTYVGPQHRLRGGLALALCVFCAGGALAQSAGEGAPPPAVEDDAPPAAEVEADDAATATTTDDGPPPAAEVKADGAAATTATNGGAPAAAAPDGGVTPRSDGDEGSAFTTTVTGTRVPQRLKDSAVATEVITRREIQESGARDLREVLQSRAGLETFQNVGTTGLRMQGLGPEYSLILIDGQRPTGRINGGIDLGRISVEDIEHIEIVKGPSSVLWGSDALAGTVNIITRRPHKPLGGSASVSYGMLNQLDARAAGEASKGPWGLAVSGGYKHRDAYSYLADTEATNGSALDQGQASLHGSYGGRDPARPSADVRVDFTRRTQVGVDANNAGAVFDRSSRDNILEGQGQARFPMGRGALGVSLGASLFDRRYIIDQRNSSALDDVQDTRDDNVQLGLQLNQALGDTQQGLVGGEVLLERMTSPRLGPGEGQRVRGALFVQDSWTPALKRRLELVGGARLDFDSSFGPAVTPRLAARFDPHPDWVLRASTGLGYRAPSFQDLLLDFENPSAGYVIDGNPDLRPERAFGNTLAAEWKPTKDWLFSLSGFWNELWDMIGYESITGGETLRFRNINLSRARTRGVEASVSWVTPFRPLSLEAGYTFNDARNLTEALPIDGQSSHRFVAQAHFRKRAWGLTAVTRLSVTGPRPYVTGEESTHWTKPWTMVDAQVSKTLGSHFELFVAGTNLAGAGDGYDLPIPPRAVFGGVSIHD